MRPLPPARSLLLHQALTCRDARQQAVAHLVPALSAHACPMRISLISLPQARRTDLPCALSVAATAAQLPLWGLFGPHLSEVPWPPRAVEAGAIAVAAAGFQLQGLFTARHLLKVDRWAMAESLDHTTGAAAAIILMQGHGRHAVIYQITQARGTDLLLALWVTVAAAWLPGPHLPWLL